MSQLNKNVHTQPWKFKAPFVTLLPEFQQPGLYILSRLLDNLYTEEWKDFREKTFVCSPNEGAGLLYSHCNLKFAI